MGVRIEDVDESKLEELQGKVVTDVAGAQGLLMAYLVGPEEQLKH